MNRKDTRGGRTTRPPLLSMKQHIIQMGWIILLLAAVILPMGLVPWVVVRSGSGWIYDRPSEPNLTVTIHFIHSVQKTPIWEYLVVDLSTAGFYFDVDEVSVLRRRPALSRGRWRIPQRRKLLSWIVWIATSRCCPCGLA